MYYTRNSDLNYYETHAEESNCGSYALRLNEWYDPEKYLEDKVGDIGEWVAELGREGYENFEASNIYAEELIEGMLKEFKGELVICEGKIPTDPQVELIAFGTFCYWDKRFKRVDVDFHFKVFRDGKWMEKCGTLEVQESDEFEWEPYNSDITYFYHKIRRGNDR